MTGPLRVGWNLLWLVPGEVGGTEQFALRHLAALQAVPDPPDLVICANRSLRSSPALGGLDVRVAPTTGRSRVRRVITAGPWLARILRDARVDVTHHLGGTIPLPAMQPTVLTVQDLLPLERPEAFSRMKRTYLRRALPGSIARATVVTTPSDFVRRQILERFDRRPDSVVVAPAPVTAPERPGPMAIAAMRAALDLDGPFVVYPAISYAHKNHTVLIDAMAALRDRAVDLTLVMTGHPGPEAAAIDERVRRHGLDDRVRRPGRLAAGDLDVVMYEAAALAFPSTWEGFGLPIAEAMASGCPVVAADATALPEAVGDAGLLVDPDDADAWADALESIVLDPERARELAAAGRERARQLAPPVAAVRLLEAYRLAVELGP